MARSQAGSSLSGKPRLGGSGAGTSLTSGFLGLSREGSHKDLLNPSHRPTNVGPSVLQPNTASPSCVVHVPSPWSVGEKASLDAEAAESDVSVGDGRVQGTQGFEAMRRASLQVLTANLWFNPDAAPATAAGAQAAAEGKRSPADGERRRSDISDASADGRRARARVGSDISDVSADGVAGRRPRVNSGVSSDEKPRRGSRRGSTPPESGNESAVCTHMCAYVCAQF